MKKLLLLGSLGVCLITGCGEDEEMKPPVQQKKDNTQAAARTRRSASYRTRPSYSSQRDRIMGSASRSERIKEIMRAHRVRKEDRAKTINLLKDILFNSRDTYEKIAAAKSLLNIGTEEAMAPVKEAFVMKTGPQVNAGILAEIKRNYGSKYRDTLAAWCAEVLNDKDVFKKYNWKNVYGALVSYETYNTGKHVFVNPEIFIQDTSKRITYKMYEIMRNYPPEQIPVPFLMNRFSENIKNKKADGIEMKKAVRVFYRTGIAVDKVDFRIDVPSAIDALNSSDPEVREGFIALLKYGWNELSSAARSSLKSKVERISENDGFRLEGGYPVRDEAKRFLAYVSKKNIRED